MRLGKMLNSYHETKPMGDDLNLQLLENVSVWIWSADRNRNQRRLIQVIEMNSITII